MKYLLSVFALSFCVACSESIGTANDAVSSLIFSNARIYTGDTENPWAESLVVKGEKIVYVGSQAGAEVFMVPGSQVLDMAGKTMMPGLIDAHVHPVLGGMELAHHCLFPASANATEVKQTLLDCAAKTKPGNWIEGGRWGSRFFADNNIESPVAWLDAISSQHPISLADDTGHNRWVNTRALTVTGLYLKAKIDGGEVVRAENGKPNGILLEAAIYPLLEHIEAQANTSLDTYIDAAQASILKASEFGLTGLKEAGDSDKGVLAFSAIDKRESLPLYFSACISLPFNEQGEPDIQRLLSIAEQSRSTKVNPNCVKLFLDGVPSEARTAAVINNYTPDENGHVHRGQLLIKPDNLSSIFTKIDALGFTIKVHAAGDRAVCETLNAIEFAQNTNGVHGRMHEIAHSGFIDPTDIPRMVKLNAVADMSPSIWYPSIVTDSIIAAMGERGKRYWPFKDLLDAGVDVIAGTDWPAVVPDMNPWPGIEAMVTRADPYDTRKGKLWPEQAISLDQAIKIYTLAGAKSIGLDEQTGVLKAGMYADFITLDRAIFKIDPQHIGETQVLLTMFRGRPVHGDLNEFAGM